MGLDTLLAFRPSTMADSSVSIEPERKDSPSLRNEKEAELGLDAVDSEFCPCARF